MRPIVCGLDFSPYSARAMRVAARLAIQRDTELVLAHGWHVPPLAYGNNLGMAASVLQELATQAKASLTTAIDEAKQLGVKRVSSRFGEALAWEAVVQIATDREAELVVVGDRGLAGVARFLLGSVADAVVRHAPCAVLVVRGEPATFDRALCAVDFSPCSKLAAERSSELGSTRITLLHAVEPEPWLINSAQLMEECRKSATYILERWEAELAPRTRATLASQIRIGRAAPSILAVLEETPYDLAIVGTHGRSGLRGVALGSVAQKIVRHAPCSVFVVRGSHAH